jgi:hypothetical protein
MNDRPSHENSIYSVLSEGSLASVLVVRLKKDWRIQLANELANWPDGMAVVVVEGWLRPIVLGILRSRRLSLGGAPTARAVRRRLTVLGWDVETSYRVWPSSAQPRVAIPIEPRTLTSWMQKNGLIGGGSRGFVRLSLRHRLALPLIIAFAGGVAMKVRTR